MLFSADTDISTFLDFILHDMICINKYKIEQKLFYRQVNRNYYEATRLFFIMVSQTDDLLLITREVFCKKSLQFLE